MSIHSRRLEKRSSLERRQKNIKIQRGKITLLLIVLFGALLISLFLQNTYAIAEKNDDVNSAGQELIDKVNELRKQRKEFYKEYLTSKGEESILAGAKILDTGDRVQTGIFELVIFLKKLQKQNLDHKSFSDDVKKIIIGESESLQTLISHYQKEIHEARNRREKSTKSELYAIEEEINRKSEVIDNLIKSFLINTERKTTLEIDNSSDLKYLDTLLNDRAIELTGRLQLVREKQNTIKEQISNASADEKKEFERDYLVLQNRKNRLAKSLSATIKLLEKRRLEASEYNQLLFQFTGEVNTKIFSRKVVYSLSKIWVKSISTWFREHSIEVIVKTLIFLLILISFRFLSTISGRIVKRALDNSKISSSTLLREFFISVSVKAVMLIGILIALSQLGIQIAPLLAGLGVVGFIIGFALQDTLSNFASGMMILIYRPYDVGDTIEAAGVYGKVKEMSIVTTTIFSLDNQKLVVPNNKIWGDVIRNVTAQVNRRVDLMFGIGYSDDIEHAENILKDIVKNHKLVLDEPAFIVKLHALSESSVDYVVRPWVKAENYWDVYWDITKQVKQRFDAEGISIPFPQRDIHIHQVAAD